MNNIIIGNCINLYYKDDEEWRKIAHSTVFRLSINLQYNTTMSKDDTDYFFGAHPTNFFWKLEGESLVVDDDNDLLFNIMTRGEKLFIGFGIINEGQSTPPEYGYMGYCWLTDLEIEAPTGDVARYRYSLKGASPLEYGQIALPDPSQPIVFNEKTTPFIEFSDSIVEEQENDDNDYTIPDLVNPLVLPIKFKITKIQ